MDNINNEIIELTNKLRNEKPLVYKHLMETPQTIPSRDEEVNKEDLIKYRDTLKNLLSNNQ